MMFTSDCSSRFVFLTDGELADGEPRMIPGVCSCCWLFVALPFPGPEDGFKLQQGCVEASLHEPHQQGARVPCTSGECERTQNIFRIFYHCISVYLNGALVSLEDIVSSIKTLKILILLHFSCGIGSQDEEPSEQGASRCHCWYCH